MKVAGLIALVLILVPALVAAGRSTRAAAFLTAWAAFVVTVLAVIVSVDS